MAKYTQETGPVGGWANKAELKTGQKCKIKNECKKEMSAKFTNKDGTPMYQDVAKVHFEGQKEPVNCNINKPTIAALVKEFGDDSLNWIDKVLTVETVKTIVNGKWVTALYLKPEGFELGDDNGYVVLIKKTTTPQGLDPRVPKKELDIPIIREDG